MSDPVVSVEHLSFSHSQGGHQQQVLNDVTLALSPGELVVLTGPSGSARARCSPSSAGCARRGKAAFGLWAVSSLAAVSARE